MKPYLLISLLAGSFCAFHPAPLYAKTTKPSRVNVRPIETSSVDVFDVLSHIPQGDKAFMHGDFALALQHYRYVYLHDPKQTHAAIGYADAALALGQNALATKIYKTIETNNPRRQSGLLLTGILDQTIGKPEAPLRAQLKLASNDARLWNMLGHILDKDSRGAEARQSYAMAQLSGQRAGLAANNIGQSFLKEGQIDKALSEFTRAVLDAPQNHLFDNNRRLTLLLQKDYAQALEQLNKDRAAQLLKDAGLIVARQGETKLAIYFLEKSIALNPVYDAKAAQYLAQLRQ